MAQISITELHKATYTYLPNIMNIVGIIDGKLDNKIQQYINDITSLAPDTKISCPHSIFSYINATAKGNIFCQDLLAYYDFQAKSLYNSFINDPRRQGKIKEKLKQSVMDISDHDAADPSNPAFLNFVAEILYAATIIPNAQNGGYEFIGFDELMDNGKDADLLFRREKDGKFIYIDNLSIHGVDISKVGTAQDLYDYLAQRIQIKFDSKTDGLTKQGNDFVINGNLTEFHVAPVLWNETCDMLPYKDAFLQFKEEGVLSLLFVALMPQEQPNGHFAFSIETVQNILSRWEEIEPINA